MKNKILRITRNIIPYVKELLALPLIENPLDCILMQQLDYWFEQYPYGFYKFLEPNENPDYREGDSWREELGFSERIFRTAFSHIGVAYISKKAYDQSPDKFQGKYYCSYYDRINKKTYYYRNHDLVDSHLDQLLKGEFTETANRSLQKQQNAVYRNNESQFTEVAERSFYTLYTETTPETTAETTAESGEARAKNEISEIEIMGEEVQNYPPTPINCQPLNFSNSTNTKLPPDCSTPVTHSVVCNTNVTPLVVHSTEVVQSKKIWELTQKDFLWVGQIYREFKPEHWTDSVPALHKNRMAFLRDAYEAVDGDMERLKVLWKQALLAIADKPSLWNMNADWLIKDCNFIGLGEGYENQNKLIPTKKLQQAIASSQENQIYMTEVLTRHIANRGGI